MNAATHLDIDESIIDKWENIVNNLAKILNVPAALIMRLVSTDITVFLASNTENNPYHPGDKEYFENSGLYCETVIKTNKMLLVPNALQNDNWKNNPDVKLNMISYLGFPILWPDKRPFGTICVLDNKANRYSQMFIDLMENFRNMIEKDLEMLTLNKSLSESVQKIQNLLTEKEILLKEVHHRIKNNIATIQSLLSLQAKNVTSPEARTALQESIGRIKSMRTLYEKLLITDSYQEISVQDYVGTLVDSIVKFFSGGKEIVLEKNIADFKLDSKKIYPLGIIINELLTNIMKYAFSDRKEGRISITLKKEGKLAILTLLDDGRGLPPDFDLNKSKGFGLMLVTMLADQLQGSFTIEDQNGTRSSLTFEI